MLSQETIRRFQQIWLKDFGQELSDKEASKLAHDTVQYFDTLAQIKSRGNENKYENQNNQNQILD